MKTAVAYYRTSSKTNVGEDKDSLKRQQDAVHSYATSNGLKIVKEYYDPGVSGADPVISREGFNEMLDYMLGNGARIVLIESASRFARDVVVQITGHELLKKHGITLIPVDAPTYFTEDSPSNTMIRGILALVSAFEKDSLVARLRKARERSGALGGNPAFGKLPVAHVEAARAAMKKDMSLRKVSAVLASQGILSASGKPYTAMSIKRMLKR